MLACSPSVVGMVIPYESFVSVWSYGGVGYIGIMADVFDVMTCGCVHDVNCI